MNKVAATRTTRFALGAAIVALVLVAALSVQGALAYFTTYAAAKGGQAIYLQTSTTITEEFEDWTKKVVITNDGEAPCYVRVTAFAPQGFELQYEAAEGWSDGGDGYWYYGEPLMPGTSTPMLPIHVQAPADTFDQAFNVVVVHEATPVSNADGTGGDWSGGQADAEAADVSAEDEGDATDPAKEAM